MKVADLPAGAVARRLRHGGLDLRLGPFIARIESPIPAVTEGITQLWAEAAVVERGFADFHVRLAPPAGLRRWFRPQVLFEFDGAAPFLPLPREQAFAFLEWGLNWCVANHAHQYLVIHAAAVERHGGVAILPAPPGSGKSTLCAGLIARGWRLLSDELTLVSLATGKVAPLPRPVSLKNESIEVIRRFAPDAVLSAPCHDTTKGNVAHMRPPATSTARDGEEAAAAWILFPRFRAGAPLELGERSRARTFMAVVENGFNYHVLGGDGFDAVATLVDRCGCFDLTYGDLTEAVATMDRLAQEQQ